MCVMTRPQSIGVAVLGQAEQRHPAAVVHVRRASPRPPRGDPDISSPMSKPSTIPSSPCASRSDPTGGDVDDEVGPGRLGQGQPLGRQVGDADQARPGVPRDRGRHDADRAGTGDEHVLADDRPLQRGVRRVAERVEQRPEVGVEVGGLHPDVGRGDDDVVGERAVAVDPHAHRVDAQVPAPGPAVAADAAHDVALAGDPVTDGHVVDVGPDLDDLAEELVAEGHRHLHGRRGPLVPLLEVQVGAAQPGPQHPDLDVLVAARRLGDVDELETGTCRDLP